MRERSGRRGGRGSGGGLLAPERGDAGDEAEPDGEGFAAGEPGGAFEGGEGEVEQPVAEDDAGEDGGVVGGEGDDLEPGEGEEAGDRRGGGRGGRGRVRW